MNADLVAINGRIFTSNDAQPWASAVAVHEGRFVHVGDDDMARSLIGPQTEVMDLEGALLLPGLVESHVHVLLGALLNVGLLHLAGCARVHSLLTGSRASLGEVGQQLRCLH